MFLDLECNIRYNLMLQMISTILITIYQPIYLLPLDKLELAQRGWRLV